MKKILNDADDKLSSKRLFTLILIVIMAIVLFGHVFFGFPLEDYIFEGLIDSIIWAIAFIGSEKVVDSLMAGKMSLPSRSKRNVDE
jgi:hypothetical protein